MTRDAAPEPGGWPPLRPELQGVEPYGAPQLDVPVCLNVNENPYGPPPQVVEDIAASVASVAAGLNRYPDREFGELRAALAGYLARETGVALGPEQIWAANGSNEIIQQLMQTFAGPGRSAFGFSPTYQMHDLISRGTGTKWIEGPRNADFTIDEGAAATALREQRPDVLVGQQALHLVQGHFLLTDDTVDAKNKLVYGLGKLNTPTQQ